MSRAMKSAMQARERHAVMPRFRIACHDAGRLSIGSEQCA